MDNSCNSQCIQHLRPLNVGNGGGYFFHHAFQDITPPNATYAEIHHVLVSNPNNNDDLLALLRKHKDGKQVVGEIFSC